jgi:hypothetical protein
MNMHAPATPVSSFLFYIEVFCARFAALPGMGRRILVFFSLYYKRRMCVCVWK